MSEEWEQVLGQNPQMLWGVVADVVKAVKADEGEKKTGRRPAARVHSIDELYAVLFPPAYTIRPFPEALNCALNGRSQRQIALYAGISQPTLSRLISGDKQPDLELIERLAAVLRVSPFWFSEYRALKLGQLLTDALLAAPALSAETVRRLTGVS